MSPAHSSRYGSGTITAFISGCRCAPCELGWYRYQEAYAIDVAHNGPRTVPVGPMLLRLVELRTAGFSLDTIARAAGVKEPVLSRMVRGMHARVGRSTAAAVCAVTYSEVLAAAPDPALVPSLGARRRLHSLMALGWPVWQQAGHCKTTANTLESVSRYSRVRASTHRLTVQIYDRLAMQPGPSATTCQRALAAGYVPPLMWDDEDIDDPDGAPVIVTAPPPETDPYIVDEVERLTAAKLSASEIAIRLPITARTVERIRSRVRAGAA